MLRIKPNIDLNELRRFGFKKEFDSDFNSNVWVWYDDKNNNIEELNIWERYLEKVNNEVKCYKNVILIETYSYADKPSKVLDVLFQLITSGYVIQQSE